jgi:hypothetical protein
VSGEVLGKVRAENSFLVISDQVSSIFVSRASPEMTVTWLAELDG